MLTNLRTKQGMLDGPIVILGHYSFVCCPTLTQIITVATVEAKLHSYT